MISWHHSSMRTLQHNKDDMRSWKSAKVNPPSKSQASFRSKTTDLDVSDVLNLMKAMISEHNLLFCNNFQMFIVHSPKIKIRSGKTLQGRRQCLLSLMKYIEQNHINILKNKFLFDNPPQINHLIVHKQKIQSFSLTFWDSFETQNLPKGPPEIENSGSRKSVSHHQTIEEKSYGIRNWW